jgi:hypothetical protein
MRPPGLELHMQRSQRVDGNQRKFLVGCESNAVENQWRVQRMPREETKGKNIGLPFLLRTDKRHSAVETDQAVNSVELQINSALGLRKGNGKPSPILVLSSIVLTVTYSGPARGYIEGLEHRLRETESLLLQILPFVPEDYLEVVTTEYKGSPGRSTTTPRRPMLNNKTNVEYWEQFPLDSIENIRRWQQDCSEGRSPYRSSGQSSQERLPQTTLEIDAMAPGDRHLSQFQQSVAPLAEILMSTEDSSTQSMRDWSGVSTTTASGMFVGHTVSSNLGQANWSQIGDMSMQGQLLQDSSNRYSGQFKLDRPEDMIVSSFYPTDFQREFFW